MALRYSFELFAYGVNGIGPGKSSMAWCPSGEAYGPNVEVSEENEAWRNAALETRDVGEGGTIRAGGPICGDLRHKSRIRRSYRYLLARAVITHVPTSHRRRASPVTCRSLRRRALNHRGRRGRGGGGGRRRLGGRRRRGRDARRGRSGGRCR